MSYLPDMGKKKCPKDFLWHTLVTLRPTWTKQVLVDAENAREEDRIKGPEVANKLVFDPEFLEALALIQGDSEGK